MSDSICPIDGCDAPIHARGLCQPHYGAERYWAKRSPRPTKDDYIQARISIQPDGCWRWTLALHGKTGYGTASWLGQKHLAHRFSYEVYVGEIPEGLQIDHLCRNRACVNPGHLEPVTAGENVRRGFSLAAIVTREQRCMRGHDLSGENLYVSPSGYRGCYVCIRTRTRAKYVKRKAELGIADARVRGACSEPECDRLHTARGLCKVHYERRRREALKAS